MMQLLVSLRSEECPDSSWCKKYQFPQQAKASIWFEGLNPERLMLGWIEEEDFVT